MPLQPVSFTTPYSAEEADIERKRKLAEALQLQGQQPLGGTEMVGGWAIPRSPFEGAAKMAQSLSGAYQQNKATEREKALGQKYQDDLSNALRRAQEAGAGSPAQTIQPDPQEAQQSADQGTPTVGPVNLPARAPNRQAMIEALMSHPATQPLAMQQLQQEMAQQQLAATLAGAGYGQQSGNPMVPGGPQSSTMAGSGPTAAAGAPAGPRMPPGVDPLAWALMVQKGDTEGLAKLVQEAGKPSSRFITTRYGVFTPDPNNPNRVTAAGGASPPGALNYQFDQQGNPSLGTLPGQEAGVAALKSAEQRGTQPFSQQMTKVPVYLHGGDQIEVNLNAPQMEEYNRTGRLPPDVAASIPGYKQPTPPKASSSAFPRETPAQNAAGKEGRLRTLNAELAQEQQALTSAKTPEEKQIAESNISALQKEIGGPGAPKGVSGAAVVGRGQSQEEQIRQTRQTSAGKAVDEQFAKDYVAFTTGGAQDAAKQISQLNDVATQLKNPDNKLTGAVRGQVPDVVRNITNPKAVAMRERVEEVVQRSLRAILGAQFTENEGKRLIERAYNPAQPQEENAIRVGRLITQLGQAFKAKQDASEYFQKNNTLSGWQGKLPSISDFNPEAGGRPPTEPALGAKTVKWSDLK